MLSLAAAFRGLARRRAGRAAAAPCPPSSFSTTAFLRRTMVSSSPSSSSSSSGMRSAAAASSSSSSFSASTTTRGALSTLTRSPFFLSDLARASFASSAAAPPPPPPPPPPPAPKPVPMPKLKDSFLDGTSSTYIEELQERYRADAASVDASWAGFFRALEAGVPAEAVAEAYHAYEQGESAVPPLSAASLSSQTIHESMKLLLLVRGYQVNGHFMADLDPLGLDERSLATAPSELDPRTYGFSEADLDREFYLGTWKMRGFLSEERPIRTLREVLQRLREAYCGPIGYEFMHIPDRTRCNWIRERVETADPPKFSPERKKHILDRLAWSEMFESFLAAKYSAAKRFGLEGCETLVPGMKALIDRAAERGVESIVLGMPHRGRLNVLANVVRKPMAQIFSEFTGVKPLAGDEHYGAGHGTGDVKYHLGTSYDRPTTCGKRVHLSLLANPSHLEAVDPVLLGKVRAKQYYSDDHDRSKSMGVLLHGDGAFAGQGVVYETLDMSALPDYTTGGTVHIIVNNQVAFTTDPRKSRSSPYCTDVAKALNAPIFHVNGDDVEAVVRACELAAEWRQAWQSDVVVDIVCYRRYGHNEIDEPMFTQPLMYKAIRKHKDPYKIYQEKLLNENVVTPDEVDAISDNVTRHLHAEFERAKDYVPEAKDWLSSYWAGFHGPNQLSRIRNTGVTKDLLERVGAAITKLPPDMTPHKQISRVYAARAAAIESGKGVDWALAEALAFGTLLSEGNHVRLSGQDVERGTFSHRHAVVHDQENGKRYVPLANVYDGQKPGQFTVSNSSLSEFGVLGFELGYALENPNALVLWEAQFGDFANGAQVIFDQFLSSGEAKWLRQNGLTVLLPHGYDGQGPEHSSARLERFLQMCDENPYVLPDVDHSKWSVGGHLGGQVQRTNWQVANVTTPANYFHLLRRQLHRSFRKPLVVMSPKNLLRHPHAKSDLEELDDEASDANIQGVRFKRLIMDEAASDRSASPPPQPDVKRLLFCTGKVYYELATERERRSAADSKQKSTDVAIVRVEQLAPFPFDLVCRELRRYPNAEVMWAQEEPMNQGAYSHVAPRLKTCMQSEGRRDVPHQIAYAGRAPSAATATGFAEVHAKEQAQLLADAVTL